MYKISKPVFLYCETSLHAGSGSSLGVVDLPIQRERHTGFPKIESSSLKGAFREAFEEKLTGDDDKKKIHIVFGYDDSEKKEKVKKFFKDRQGDFMACLGNTDARLLLFPVKSMQGVFAWITCPAVVERFIRDIRLCDIKPGFESPEPGTCAKNTKLIVQNNNLNHANNIILEEYTFPIEKNDNTTKMASLLADNIFPKNSTDFKFWQDKLKQDIIVLNNDDYKDFVNLSTEVVTRTKIDNETGVVVEGQLFTEEYLPSESILYTLVMTNAVMGPIVDDFEEAAPEKQANKIMEYFTKNLPDVIQVSGNATIGKGIVRTNYFGKETKNG